METCGEVVGVADVVGALEEAIAEVVAREFEEEGERSAIVSGARESEKVGREMKRGCDKDLDVVYVVLQCTIRRCLLWLPFPFCRLFPVPALADILKLARFGYRSGRFYMVCHISGSYSDLP